jgi:hypothetical protein
MVRNKIVMVDADKGKTQKKDQDAERTNIGVSIDKVLWRKLRAMAIAEQKVTCELLDAAIQEYIDRHKK